MELKLSESNERTLNEIEMLEFELDGCSDFSQRLSMAAELIKKLYFLYLLKIMIPIEKEITEKDLEELRRDFKELSCRINSVSAAIKSGSRIECDSVALDIIEKLVAYLKGAIISINFFSKSRRIQLNS